MKSDDDQFLLDLLPVLHIQLWPARYSIDALRKMASGEEFRLLQLRKPFAWRALWNMLFEEVFGRRILPISEPKNFDEARAIERLSEQPVLDSQIQVDAKDRYLGYLEHMDVVWTEKNIPVALTPSTRDPVFQVHINTGRLMVRNGDVLRERRPNLHIMCGTQAYVSSDDGLATAITNVAPQQIDITIQYDSSTGKLKARGEVFDRHIVVYVFDGSKSVRRWRFQTSAGEWNVESETEQVDTELTFAPEVRIMDIEVEIDQTQAGEVTGIGGASFGGRSRISAYSVRTGRDASIDNDDGRGCVLLQLPAHFSLLGEFNSTTQSIDGIYVWRRDTIAAGDWQRRNVPTHLRLSLPVWNNGEWLGRRQHMFFVRPLRPKSLADKQHGYGEGNIRSRSSVYEGAVALGTPSDLVLTFVHLEWGFADTTSSWPRLLVEQSPESTTNQPIGDDICGDKLMHQCCTLCRMEAVVSKRSQSGLCVCGNECKTKVDARWYQLKTALTAAQDSSTY